MSLCYGREGSTHTWAGPRVPGELKEMPPLAFPIPLSCYLLKLFWDGFLSLGSRRIQVNNHLTKNNLHIPNGKSVFKDSVFWRLFLNPLVEINNSLWALIRVHLGCCSKNTINCVAYKQQTFLSALETGKSKIHGNGRFSVRWETTSSLTASSTATSL